MKGTKVPGGNPAESGTQKPMQLETERLILRPWKSEDAEELYLLARDPEIGPAAGWLPHENVEDSAQVLEHVLMVPETWAVVLKDTGKPAGSISLMPGSRSHLPLPADEAEIGYWIGRQYWGRGLIPEAAAALIDHGKEDLGLARIWCGWFDGNEKSRRVQEKLGFRYDRTDRDIPCAIPGVLHTVHISRDRKSVV